MLIGKRRLILICAVVAVAIVIIIYPLLVSWFSADLNQARIELDKVEVTGIDQEQHMLSLQVVFAITNPTDITLTTSKIDYELFADRTPIGNFILSYEDVPVNGRPAIFPGTSTNLRSNIQLNFANIGEDTLAKIQGNSTVRWKAQGTAQIQTALTELPKEFNSEA